MAYNCVVCGRFIGAADIVHGHYEYTPETEFGHEHITWECRRCANGDTAIADRNPKGGDVKQAPLASGGGAQSAIAQGPSA